MVLEKTYHLLGLLQGDGLDWPEELVFAVWTTQGTHLINVQSTLTGLTIQASFT